MVINGVRILSSLVLIAVVLLAAGCQQQTPAGTFVAEIPNAGVAIGLAAAEGRVIAYVCDGLSVSEWFRGDTDGSSVDLTSANGIRLQAEVSAEQATGTLTLPDGQVFPFTAEAAADGAGFYRAESSVDGADVVGGWILLADGRQVGAIAGLGGGIGGLGGLTSGLGGTLGGIGGIGGQTGGVGGFGGGLGGSDGLGGIGGLNGGIGGIGGVEPFSGEEAADGGQTGGSAETTGSNGDSGTTGDPNPPGEASDGSGSDGSTTAADPGATDGGTAPTLTPDANAAPVQVILPAPPFDPQVGTVETPIGVLTPTPCQLLLAGS